MAMSRVIVIATALLLMAAPTKAVDPDDLARLRDTNACPGCDISEGFLRFSNFNGADLTGANLRDAFFLESQAIGAIFINADLTMIGSENTLMREADFTGAVLIDGNFTNTDLRDAIFVGASMAGVTFTGAVLSGANMTGADLTEATIDRTGLNETNLTDADLTGATITRTSLSSAVLCRTTMPDGTVDNSDCP